MSFLDAIASPSSYLCQWVNEWVIHNFGYGIYLAYELGAFQFLVIIQIVIIIRAEQEFIYKQRNALPTFVSGSIKENFEELKAGVIFWRVKAEGNCVSEQSSTCSSGGKSTWSSKQERSGRCAGGFAGGRPRWGHWGSCGHWELMAVMVLIWWRAE